MPDTTQIDSTLLAQLYPVYTPEAISFAPETVGWVILAALVGVLFIFAIILFIKKYRARRYRRLAVSLLDSLDINDAGKIIIESCEILKRVALKSYERTQIAALTGNEWIEFLEEKNKPFDPATRDIVVNSQYKPAELSRIGREQGIVFMADIKNWIKNHRV